MKNADFVVKLEDALMARDYKQFSDCLAENFTCTGVSPEPINKEGYVHMMKMMLAAFPDFSNNLKIVGEKAGIVHGSLELCGTHTNELDLSIMGMPKIPATDKSFKLGQDTFRAKISDGKISNIDITLAEGGGFPGIFAQLGIDLGG